MEQNKITKPKPTRQEAVDRLLRQLPAMDRKNALQCHHDQETCKFAGKFKSMLGLHLVSC